LDIDQAPPRLEDARLTGASGVPVRLKIPALSENPLTFAINRRAGTAAWKCPTGLSISSDGVLTWQKPTPATHVVKVWAKETAAPIGTERNYTLRISEPPAVIAATVKGKAGISLSFNPATNPAQPGARTTALIGATVEVRTMPNAFVYWPSPIAGTHDIDIRVTDGASNLGGDGRMRVVIEAAKK
jgi:hypothetical protein